MSYRSPAPAAVPQPTAQTVSAALSAAGLPAASTDIIASEDLSILTMRDGSAIVWTFTQRQGFDAAASDWGFLASYPMTVTAPATAPVNTAATVTADTGDAAFAGDVDFYVGGTLQGPVAAVGGKASLPVTGTATGDVTVTAWVQAYGYASATIAFQ